MVSRVLVEGASRREASQKAVLLVLVMLLNHGGNLRIEKHLVEELALLLERQEWIGCLGLGCLLGFRLLDFLLLEEAFFVELRFGGLRRIIIVGGRLRLIVLVVVQLVVGKQLELSLVLVVLLEASEVGFVES